MVTSSVFKSNVPNMVLLSNGLYFPSLLSNGLYFPSPFALLHFWRQQRRHFWRSLQRKRMRKRKRRTRKQSRKESERNPSFHPSASSLVGLLSKDIVMSVGNGQVTKTFVTVVFSFARGWVSSLPDWSFHLKKHLHKKQMKKRLSRFFGVASDDSPSHKAVRFELCPFWVTNWSRCRNKNIISVQPASKNFQKSSWHFRSQIV